MGINSSASSSSSGEPVNMGFRIWRKKSRSNHAENNSRLFLKELIKSFDGKCNPNRIFTEKELSKATHNYDPDLLIRYDFCKLYRGELGDWPIVVHTERFINELVVLSQIKHKHVVRLLGCCLEADLPILVYGFSHVNKNLKDLIINDHPSSLLSWESRLRIATEIADAITYIHTFSSRPIIHRDIKLSNIFLDHQDVARLYDFSLCIRIPDGQTHAKDLLRGTLGYLDPTYRRTSQVSEKADIYSFGVVLLEILSGKSYFDLSEGSEYDEFETQMRSLIEQDRHCRQLVDPRITEVKGQLSAQHLEACANLIIRCTNKNEDERPEMIEVEKELRRIWKTTHVQPH